MRYLRLDVPVIRAALWMIVTPSIVSCVKLHDVTIGKAGADYWFAELSGDVDQEALPGGSIDVDDTLDLEDEDIVNLHAAAQLGNFTIDASYFDADYDGKNQLFQTIDFAGEQFTLGTDVDSELKLKFASAKVGFGLFEIGPLVLGALVGVDYFDLDGELQSSLPPITAKEDLSGPFPVVGAVATVHQPLGDDFTLFASAEISGIYVEDVFDVEGGFFDLAARVGIQFSVVRIGGGYRLLDMDFEDTDDDFRWDLDLGGPFVLAEIAF